MLQSTAQRLIAATMKSTWKLLQSSCCEWKGRKARKDSVRGNKAFLGIGHSSVFHLNCCQTRHRHPHNMMDDWNMVTRLGSSQKPEMDQAILVWAHRTPYFPLKVQGVHLKPRELLWAGKNGCEYLRETLSTGKKGHVILWGPTPGFGVKKEEPRTGRVIHSDKGFERDRHGEKE